MSPLRRNEIVQDPYSEGAETVREWRFQLGPLMVIKSYESGAEPVRELKPVRRWKDESIAKNLIYRTGQVGYGLVKTAAAIPMLTVSAAFYSYPFISDQPDSGEMLFLPVMPFLTAGGVYLLYSAGKNFANAARFRMPGFLRPLPGTYGERHPKQYKALLGTVATGAATLAVLAGYECSAQTERGDVQHAETEKSGVYIDELDVKCDGVLNFYAGRDGITVDCDGTLNIDAGK